jgi:hypothetical protein
MADTKESRYTARELEIMAAVIQCLNDGLPKVTIDARSTALSFSQGVRPLTRSPAISDRHPEAGSQDWND